MDTRSHNQEWISEAKAEELMQEKERREIEERTTTDFDTGILNKRGLMEFGSKLVAQRDRDDLPVSLLMLDVDNMKGLNERYGHQGTNELLKKFAQHLVGMVRAGDVIGRYAGDEFVVVLAAPKHEIPARFHEPFVTEINNMSATISFTAGAIELVLDGRDAKQVLDEGISRADAILMETKGKNKGTVEIR